ncbi:MAG TPA: macro domain-containing protein [Candidatus Onthousia faecavium]|nr:macro domain-containing protein [Candidatus Onthousia faecavium]
MNAANRNLISGGGICGVIYKKAGYSNLNEVCRKIKTPLKDGDAVLTPAFDIKNAKYIIHAVGPNFSYTPNALNKLFDAYYNSLLLMNYNNLHSIAFPLISAGIYGGHLANPAAVSTKQCIVAYNKFIENFPDYNIRVILCA